MYAVHCDNEVGISKSVSHAHKQLHFCYSYITSVSPFPVS